MSLQKASASKEFVSIIGGKFRKQVEEGTPESIKRDYEKSDGSKGVKYELVFDSVEGVISNVSFADTDFGKVFHIEIDGVTVSTGTDGRYFADIIKRLAGADLSKPVTLRPYDFEAEGKKLTGVSVKQGGEKLKNFFYDGEKNLHGFPVMEDENPDSDDWKIYFTKVKKFLVKYVEDNMMKVTESDFNMESVSADVGDGENLPF